jgi:hypothetical protein
MKWVDYIECMGQMTNAYKILDGKTDGQMSLGRHRRRLKDNIKMDLREIGKEVLEWITWFRILTNGSLVRIRY